MYYTLVHKSLGPVKLNPKTFSEVASDNEFLSILNC